MKRESGIELLRLLAATSIIYGHFLNSGELPWGGVKPAIYWFLRIPGISGVDLFMLIMGYYMCTSTKRTIGKPLSLILQMVFYNVGVYLLFVALGWSEFSIRNLVLKFLLANSWFVTLYTVIYFISPYVNIILNKLSSVEWKRFLLIYLLFYSIWPMFLGIVEHFSGHYFECWSTMGFGGSHAGFNIVTYLLMYCIGAFLRLQKIPDRVSKKTAWLSIVIIWIVSMCIRLIPINSSPWHIIGFYDNIFVIAFAAFAFIAFKKITLMSNFVNHIARAAFAIYLIHPAFINIIDTKGVIRMPFYESLPTIVAIIIGISVISWLFYSIFNMIFRRIVNQFDKIQVHYFEIRG